MKHLVVSLIVVVAFLSIADWRCAPIKAEDKEPSLMRKKLEYAQRTLSGIATADFEAIRQNAEAMQALSRSKAFSPLKSPEYRAQFLMFDFATTDLITQAKAKNLDGAALAQSLLTLSCVKCHKQVRDARK